MAESLERQIKSLSLNNDPDTVTRKPQQYMVVSGDFCRNSSLSFQDHKLLGGFQITENLKYGKNLHIHQLISLQSMQKLKGNDLGVDFNTAIKISNYKSFHELKQDFFLKWLIEENYHKHVQEKKYKKPNFICFGGRITDPMLTPENPRFGKWKIYAAKFNDVIYLWNERENEGCCDLRAYYGIFLEHLLTHDDPKASNINEFDKVFVINEITFGSHQLLCLNEIDAQTDYELAEIKTYESCSLKKKYTKVLKWWGQSIVPGVTKIVIGEHQNGKLKNVEITSTNTMATKYKLQVKKCYDFQDRLLKFINSHFKRNNPSVVKSFSWRNGDFNVNVDNVPEECVPKSMLPQWYIDDVLNQVESKSGAIRETKLDSEY